MNALTLVHNAIKAYVSEGGVCIDATAGRGYDTAFLCELVGKTAPSRLSTCSKTQ